MRKIIHIDMDAFFASVEQRDDPSLKGKPVIVGGSPDSRGVVCAASYEARKFGVHSAMPSSQAARLCPQGVFLKTRFDAYREASKEVMEILREYTDLVEPLSLDEAYLDVTSNKKGIRFATEVAKRLRADILAATKLTASAGVAPNKFIAKIASDMNKPDGLTVIPPDKVDALLETLPVRKVPGIGKVTEDKLHQLGINTTGDLRTRSEDELIELFGKTGSWYYNVSRGIDERPVVSSRVRKSIGAEDTFSEDSTDIDFLTEKLNLLCYRVAERAKKTEAQGRTITVKVTYSDFEKITRGKTLLSGTADEPLIFDTAVELLLQTEAGSRPVRLVGVSLSNLHYPDSEKHSPKSRRFIDPRQLEIPFPSEHAF